MSEIFFLKEKIHNVIKWDFSYGHLGKGGGGVTGFEIASGDSRQF